MNSPILSPKVKTVAVEYDGPNGKRLTKVFSDVFASRRFYVAKSKAGKNPRVTSASLA